MDVGGFLALLLNKALYFPRKHELKDPWEGAVPTFSVQQAARKLSTSEEYNLSAEETVHQTGESVATQAVISCWHENSCESVAMWHLYTSGAEGVAIQTTIGRLKGVLAQEPCRVTIARVRYIDHLTEYVGETLALDSLAPLFCKGRGFVHEQEVRCVIKNPEGERTEALVCSEVNTELKQRFPVLNQLATVADCDLGDRGLALQVDLVALIEKIVVSPRYPVWAITALQEVVGKAGLVVRVETSSLFERPPNSTTE